MLNTYFIQYFILSVHKYYLPLHCQYLIDVGIGRMKKV